MNIIELAKEAGALPISLSLIGEERLTRFAALVRAEVEAEWIETNKALAKEIIEREWVDLTNDEIDESWCIEPKPINGLLVAEPVKPNQLADASLEPVEFIDRDGNTWRLSNV